MPRPSRAPGHGPPGHGPPGREPPGRRAARFGLAALLGGAAVLHVRRPHVFEAMVPPWVPGAPRAWNLASGALEAAAAGLLARRSTAQVGGAVAAATLVAVFPANLDAALRDGTPGLRGWAGSRSAAVLRLPFQLPPLWAAVRLARGER